ncbi:hypothetical protein R1sor_008441 [Riccia sorocarpa]|uniref:Uncharacterized protein n=1 Tax=Riccia sorocarpa TaxID=122646 RepID=A0ABD3HXG5_9MARC
MKNIAREFHEKATMDEANRETWKDRQLHAIGNNQCTPRNELEDKEETTPGWSTSTNEQEKIIEGGEQENFVAEESEHTRSISADSQNELVFLPPGEGIRKMTLVAQNSTEELRIHTGGENREVRNIEGRNNYELINLLEPFTQIVISRGRAGHSRRKPLSVTNKGVKKRRAPSQQRSVISELGFDLNLPMPGGFWASRSE